jgi:hypothetical protein
MALSYPVPDFDTEVSGSEIFTSRVDVAQHPLFTTNDSKDDEQAGIIWRAVMAMSSTWDSARQTLGGLRDLPFDWDSFGGDPIPSEAIDNALQLIDNVSGLEGEADWVEPTSEGAIALQSRFAETTVRFEIDDSGIVGVAIKDPNTETVYFDASLVDVAARVVAHKV